MISFKTIELVVVVKLALTISNQKQIHIIYVFASLISMRLRCANVRYVFVMVKISFLSRSKIRRIKQKKYIRINYMASSKYMCFSLYGLCNYVMKCVAQGKFASVICIGKTNSSNPFLYDCSLQKDFLSLKLDSKYALVVLH